MLYDLRRSDHIHARALIHRRRFALAFETEEHLEPDWRDHLARHLERLRERHGTDEMLIDRASKSPHQFAKSRVLVRRFDGSLVPIEQASDFIGHLSPIESYRIFAAEPIRQRLADELRELWVDWQQTS